MRICSKHMKYLKNVTGVLKSFVRGFPKQNLRHCTGDAKDQIMRNTSGDVTFSRVVSPTASLTSSSDFGPNRGSFATLFIAPDGVAEESDNVSSEKNAPKVPRTAVDTIRPHHNNTSHKAGQRLRVHIKTTFKAGDEEATIYAACQMQHDSLVAKYMS